MHSYFIKREPKQTVDYEKKYWGTIVDPDGKVRDRLQEREQYLNDIHQEIEFLNNLPGGRILDIGCGLGFLLSGLKSEWEKYGTEVSNFAATYADQWGNIYRGELKEANYPDQYFDAVVIYHVIEHIEDPIDSIQEIHRILKPGGTLLLGTPDFDCAMARRFGKNFRLLHDPTHISLFSYESMNRFLKDHGFNVERVEFPFFETRHFTPENMMRVFDTTKMSPPFYGNIMTFYCNKTA